MISEPKPLSWSSASPLGAEVLPCLGRPPTAGLPWTHMAPAGQGTWVPMAGDSDALGHPSLSSPRPLALKTSVLSPWHAGLLPSCKRQVCCLHHMSPTPGRGSSRPKLGLTRKWLRSQISHKIWILPYRKLKPQQQNINQARENRIYLPPEKPSCWQVTLKPQHRLNGSKVKPGEYQRNDYNCVFPGWKEIRGLFINHFKVKPMATGITNMKVTQ